MAKTEEAAGAEMKKGPGRPKIKIDKKQFESYCEMQATEIEIAARFGCSIDTINNWCKATYGSTFEEVFAEKRKGGFISLRRALWNLKEHNAATAIFLAKNLLGYSDDPKKYEKDSIVEDKIDKFIDTLTDALAPGGTYTDGEDGGGDDDDEGSDDEGD